MFKEFKEFAMRGNVLDMAIGIVMGAAFGAIINSMVADVITPPLGLLLGNVDFSNLFIILKGGHIPGPYISAAAAKAAGAITLNVGLFVNSIISFLMIAFPIFLLIRSMNRIKRKEIAVQPVTTKECSFCASSISIKATRCPHCTSQLA